LELLYTSAAVVQKLKNKTGWEDNKNGTNESKFSALPAGYRNPDGGFYGLKTDAKWWGASKRDGMGYCFYIYFFSSKATKIYHEPKAGLSVRCIKD